MPHNHVLHTHKDSENGGTHGGNQAAINVMFYVFNPTDLGKLPLRTFFVAKLLEKYIVMFSYPEERGIIGNNYFHSSHTLFGEKFTRGR